MKKTEVNNIKAGKATLDNTLCIRSAALGQKRFVKIPVAMGSNISSKFWAMRLPTGKCMIIPLLSPATCVANSIMTGIVNRVIMLLRAVNETESATSPLAIIENILEELPPGEQAMSTNPIKNRGSR